jgi:hypothetical protein
LDLSRNLFPLAFNLIPIHRRPLAFCARYSSESPSTRNPRHPRQV